jgi:predicted AAA+ superfamily ATPase
MPIENKKFDLDLPEPESGGVSIVMVGSTRSGKTTIMKHLNDVLKKCKTHIIYFNLNIYLCLKFN